MSEISSDKVAKSFTRLGWTGFWVQLVLATIPLFLLGYFLFGKATGAAVRLDFTEYLAVVGLIVLGFTTLWSLRYAGLGKRMADPDRRPLRATLTKVLWIGVWASAVGIAISLVLLFAEVLRLMFLFMTAPQGGVPVVQTQVDNRTAWVSAIDVVSLLADLCTLTGELMVLGFTLWLLYRVARLPDSYA
jgi:hypothetical protein